MLIRASVCPRRRCSWANRRLRIRALSFAGCRGQVPSKISHAFNPQLLATLAKPRSVATAPTVRSNAPVNLVALLNLVSEDKQTIVHDGPPNRSLGGKWQLFSGTCFSPGHQNPILAMPCWIFCPVCTLAAFSEMRTPYFRADRGGGVPPEGAVPESVRS